MIDVPVQKKGTAVATAATVGGVRRVTGKILAGTVGTVGTLRTSPSIHESYEVPTAYNYEDTVFNTAWAATSAEGTDPFIGMTRRAYSPYRYNVYRKAHLFDTTTVPAGATITAAELWFQPYSKTETAGAFNLVVQNGQPTYQHDPAVVGDYNKANYSGDGGSIASSAITDDVWNKITLNATGLTWIQKGAATKLCLRTSLDIAGTAPGTGQGSYIGYSGGTGYYNKPYLKIWYTL
jgi:hypothetical protein